jgi:hypothetical protein
MPYHIAGIDVHKKMLAVVVADVEIDGDFHFNRLKVATTSADLRGLADWLIAQDVEEVVMESTAQYWRPVWEALEHHWRPRRRARAGASRLVVSGARTGGQRRGEEGASAQDDPRTAKSRLPRRTYASSIEQPGMIGRFSTLAHP